MARLPRVVVPGLPHHVTQRGNYQQDVFRCDQDRETYMGLLQEHSRAAHLRLIGYCLMTNHVHLIGVPEAADSLAKAIGRTHCRYAQWAHAREHCVGHLWQNRFFSTVMDEAHLAAAMCYVEQNPVRAGIVRYAREYTWSSAAAHLIGDDPRALLDLRYWGDRFSLQEWQAVLDSEGDAGIREQIRTRTNTGRPLGSHAFLNDVERRLGRKLNARPIGRPRKPALTPPYSPPETRSVCAPPLP